LMYHHIQEEETAKKNGQTNLTVTPEFFRKHLQYLKDNNYSVITMADLKNFFDNGVALPQKSAIITIDNGYKDNHDIAYPILKEFGFRATIFTATGLLENAGYMSWNDLNEMKDLVYFANHTWSHHNSLGTKEKLTEEITLADKQLAEHGLNNLKIFAYPYGTSGKTTEEVLKTNGYEIAFTTTHGNILCKGKSLELPRIRMGNASLKSYGL
jgi:peptidoglycan/xylan/chitin deacetylase (PgdA/CDA1 family)